MSRPRPLVCAHRGAGTPRADNTPQAFLAAIEQGAEMLETDVRRAADGTLVLAHDPLPDGMAGGAMPLAALVELAGGRVALDLELKETGYEREVLAAVSPRPPGLIVTSFLPQAVAAVRALDPAVEAGLLVGRRGHGDPVAEALECGSSLLAPHESLVDGALLDAAKTAALPLVVWTVNGVRRIQELCRAPGVAVVITDSPARALAIRDGQASGSVSVSDSG